MIGEILAIGDELLSGRVINTTSSFVASRLFINGHFLKRITVVGDDTNEIKKALLSALRNSQFVIISGGLGPTTDDITNEAVSKALGLPLEKNNLVQQQIEEMEAHLDKGALKQFMKKLTMLPKGAKVLNPQGHAAGYQLEYGGVYLFFLPGVPEQLKDHMVKRVIPRLNELDSERPFVVQRLFKLFGPTETEINVRLKNIEKEHSEVKIGYYPVFPEVHISITASSSSQERVDEAIFKASSVIKSEFEKDIVAIGDEGSLEETLGQIMTERNLVLSSAESCTGGLLGATVTGVSGSSNWFDRSIVTYTNRAKEQNLGVRHETLSQYGAVSKETALEMVRGVRRLTGTDVNIAITGIAGPTGGTKDKPVGTVFIGVMVKDRELVHRFLFPGSRNEVRRLTVETALDWIRRILLYDTLLPGYKPLQ